jgi:hypothetical protein
MLLPLLPLALRMLLLALRMLLAPHTLLAHSQLHKQHHNR